MKILTNSKSPFATEHAAKIQAGRLHLKEFNIVPDGDGYAIETEEAVETRSEENAEQEEKKAVKKHRVTTPWKPATLLDISEKYKNKDFVYRFCDTKKDGNIQKKMAEGWEVDKELSKKMAQARPTLDDGSRQDGTTRIRELVVMRMPKETAEARNRYFLELAGKTMKNSADQLKEELGEQEYGDIRVETF